MIDLIIIILHLLNDKPHVKQPQIRRIIPTTVCERDMEQIKDLRKRLDILIGCSTINGKQVYTERELERLWNEAINSNKKQSSNDK